MKTSDRLTCDCDSINEYAVNRVKNNMPPDSDFDKMTLLYKMFADFTRVKILWALTQETMCVCDLAVLLNMTKSAISHQLKQLRLLNLVKHEKKGQMVLYRLADDHIYSLFETGFEHIRH